MTGGVACREEEAAHGDRDVRHDGSEVNDRVTDDG